MCKAVNAQFVPHWNDTHLLHGYELRVDSHQGARCRKLIWVEDIVLDDLLISVAVYISSAETYS